MSIRRYSTLDDAPPIGLIFFKSSHTTLFNSEKITDKLNTVSEAPWTAYLKKYQNKKNRMPVFWIFAKYQKTIFQKSVSI